MPSVMFVKSETEFTFRDVVSLLECRENMRFGCKTGNCGLCRVKVLSGMENITGKTLKEKRLFKLLGIEIKRCGWRASAKSGCLLARHNFLLTDNLAIEWCCLWRANENRKSH